jgi:hypothetical protein
MKPKDPRSTDQEMSKRIMESYKRSTLDREYGIVDVEARVSDSRIPL